jgi:hypothetical protein
MNGRRGRSGGRGSSYVLLLLLGARLSPLRDAT